MPVSCVCRDTVIYKSKDGRAPEPVTTNLEGRSIADATLFRIDSRYWIAYTDWAIGLHDNLCLLHSDDLRGPWVEHVANPVEIDIGSSRSAGTPFQIDARRYRPAQDCAESHGCAIAINEIERIDELQDQEKTAAYIRPDPESPHPEVRWDAILRKAWRRIGSTAFERRSRDR
jgi:hypothetical protein